MQKVWEKYDSRRKEEAIWEWLPLLQDDVSSALGSEVKWTLHNLPDHYPAIVISLLQTFASKHQQQLAHHMTVDLQQGVHYHKLHRSVPENIFMLFHLSSKDFVRLL